MNVKLDGKKLVITIDAETKNPKASKSGKSKVIASSGGNVLTAVKVDGKPLYVGVNAYIRD